MLARLEPGKLRGVSRTIPIYQHASRRVLSAAFGISSPSRSRPVSRCNEHQTRNHANNGKAIIMAQFTVLTGSALNKAINERGAVVATFTEREHQLAYSALNHVELHNDPKYLNALLNVTPVNYRKGLIDWACAFGKVKFDKDAKGFAFAKGKESNMPGALDVAPANFAKEAGKGAKAPKALIERVESMSKKAIEDESATREDKAFARALANFTEAYKRSLTAPKAAPAKDKVRLIKGKAEAAPAPAEEVAKAA